MACLEGCDGLFSLALVTLRVGQLVSKKSIGLLNALQLLLLRLLKLIDCPFVSQGLVSHLLCMLLGLPLQLNSLLLQKALLALEQGLIAEFLAV